jgi:hypothetical protein
LVPAACRYLMPNYHPSQDHEPSGYTQWQSSQVTAIAG